MRRVLLAAATCMALTSCDSLLDASGPTSYSQSLYFADGWSPWRGPGYLVGLTDDRHGGKLASFIKAQGAAETVGMLTQRIRADAYRGKRVRLSGWVKTIGVAANTTSALAPLSGLWMRVDGPGVITAFDDMSDRPVLGQTDWTPVSVVLDVPLNAVGLSYGGNFRARGLMVFDDLQLDVVGLDVRPTNTLSTTVPSDSATAVFYGRDGLVLRNGTFEGVPLPTPATASWLGANALALATTDPSASLADLEGIRNMVGSAHVVGLGEATHGTREFFLMKHRIVKFLVTQMGFTHFAIEATSAEADDINRFVITGQGNPKDLLSRLYFWTWNTQEVLDMILWMREWNATAPSARRVQFLGVDMQYPGTSMDSVAAYVARIDPASGGFVAQQYACLDNYRNHGHVGASASSYARLGGALKSACALALKSVYDLLVTNRAAYEAASGASAYESVLHHARIAQQFEAMASGVADSTKSSLYTRDAFMAENAMWIRSHAAPESKLVLWAHNGHVSRVPGFMGDLLAQAYGSDYVTLGMILGAGTFHAIVTGTAVGTGLATANPLASLEAAFDSVGKPIMLLDTHRIASGGAATAPLAGVIEIRSVGAVYYYPTNTYIESPWFVDQMLPRDFDMMLYVRTTTPTTLLPFTY